MERDEKLLLCCTLLHIEATHIDMSLQIPFKITDRLQTIAELKADLFDAVQRAVALAAPGAALRETSLTDLKKDSVACVDNNELDFYLVPGDAPIFTTSIKWIPPPNYELNDRRANLGAPKGCAGFGTAVLFADVSNNGALELRQWASNAPDWRKAEPGLCVEGKCTNTACVAFGRMVIINKRMCHFDLIQEKGSCACPMCTRYVEPITCAFNRCDWRFSGVKNNPAGGQPTRCLGPWRSAGNQYERFKDSQGSQADWIRLLVVTQDIKKAPKVQEPSAPRLQISDCAICLDHLPHLRGGAQIAIATTSCGHMFHLRCLAAWVKLPKRTCPYCRTDITNMVQQLGV